MWRIWTRWFARKNSKLYRDKKDSKEAGLDMIKSEFLKFAFQPYEHDIPQTKWRKINYCTDCEERWPTESWELKRYFVTKYPAEYSDQHWIYVHLGRTKFLKNRLVFRGKVLSLIIGFYDSEVFIKVGYSTLDIGTNCYGMIKKWLTFALLWSLKNVFL